MIDTDKYEGHTQGHWATTTRKGTWVVYTQDNGDVATMNDYEDAKLIADAPLLLAEVERLREVISRATNTLLSNPPEEMFEFTSPTLAQDIGDLVGFYTQAMGYAIGILEGTE